MNIIRFSSTLAVLLAITACSEDDDATPTTQTAANQPAAGSAGRAGAGGSASNANAGSGGAPATASGGSSAEAPDDDIDLAPSDDDDGNASGANGDGSSDDSPPTASDAGVAPDADAGVAPDADAGAIPTPPADAGNASLSFFVTSRGGPDGANLGGLEGADALCQTLAAAVSPEIGAKTWRAYLSTTTVNARDRIGDGPWFNAAGVLVANNVTQLTDQGAGGTLDQTWAPGDASIALDELGNQVPAGGAGGVQHDILTGTLADGTVATGLTCQDWTSATGTVQVGHSNRGGFGDAPTSWSSAHANVGCAPLTAPAPNVGSGGGRGSIYCFAAD